MTSSRVAGVEETDCLQSWPSSSHSRGGRMESRISSVSDLARAPFEVASELSLAASPPPGLRAVWTALLVVGVGLGLGLRAFLSMSTGLL